LLTGDEGRDWRIESRTVDRRSPRLRVAIVVEREAEAKAVLGKLSERWEEFAEMIAEMK
jgi:hypothetical protein